MDTGTALYDLTELCNFNERFYDEVIGTYITRGTNDNQGSTLGLI